MKKRIIVLFILNFLLLMRYKHKSAYMKNVNLSNEENKKIEEKDTQKVDIVYKDEIINIDLENYVIGVVACEMPASFNSEALKAMAVAARTYALYKIETNENYKLSTTTKDQCYQDLEIMKNKWGDNFDKYYNKIKDAVMSTKNEKMTYDDKTIISFYFSISNGYTENSENVFSQKLDYLKSVDSTWDKNYDYKEKEVVFDLNEFLDKLGIISNKIDNIDIERSNTGRANYITINNNKYKGTKFRSLLGLRSTDVDIKYDDEKVYISTRGYGHGVGMSQYGANAMANEGYNYEEILKHYYSGIEIMYI